MDDLCSLLSSSSIIVKTPVPNYTAYALSKNALDGLTRQWAVELSKKYHLTVNGISVGPTDHEGSGEGMNETRVKARAQLYERTTAEGRAGIVDDYAQLVAWLCSEGSRWVNGQILNGNGGVGFIDCLNNHVLLLGFEKHPRT
jgi:3-oxoacyl-[acyl-carrier protein] reductase